MNFSRFSGFSSDSDLESDASSLEAEDSDYSGGCSYTEAATQPSGTNFETRRQRRPPAKYMTTPLVTARGSRKVTASAANVKNKPRAPVLEQCNASGTSKRDRMLMRPWLVMMADQSRIPNMCWYNEQHTQIKIPWKHGSRSCWTLEDCLLYKAWAEHTGKYCASRENEPKRWKANFRCALNSLPDVVEVKNAGQARGNCPFKVYELKPQSSKKTFTKKSKKYSRPKADSTKKSLNSTESSPDILVHPAVSTTRQDVEVWSARQTSGAQRLPTPSNVQTPQSRQGQQVHCSSSVIPTVVEELDYDELALSQDDDLVSNETEFAVQALALDPSSWITTPSDYIIDAISESSGYRTDSSSADMSWSDIDIDSNLASMSALDNEPELDIEQTHAYVLLDDPSFVL